MVTKPARMYSRITGPAYTRKEFMGGVPYPKITTFVQGNQKKDFPIEMRLVAEEPCQIRHTALEAARVSVNRRMTEAAGLDYFYLKVVPYPHHVLREHKMATGAGADRISSGMRAAFGRPVGTAARVYPDDVIMIARTDEAHAKELKTALRKAAIKLPTPCKVVITKGKEIAGSLGI
ncbi:50S ribosomal protein L16 [Thermoplasma acidophilum]|uniref:Large ribosomal subunit protein uL16 n=1 Tax=Thermoplasma acidophilum (strain ATCC 25905 / DSM 1728 / JCM 9062 / NBRC 15155 / AMRC-C165) TaxID=273075 RepID=RL10E_THEAC|nr:50S ribosomal protein L16 [Thermoplasma acidophilum]Q9HJB3.2 RecName: Full=Large ribosomal subunit protein uL16; AltName: Full=50S ribosomal protein L10e [Thermoplasma acidophilum DSM 1728]MCY0851790.1 50S ribosomal protein L16 [Thermoplasma acidophilum]BAE53570.1 50S ribosomal protein L10E [Thermoplasma acidophilum]